MTNEKLKKRLKIFLLSISILFTLIIITFSLIFYSSWFQTYITNTIASSLTKNSNLKITIDKIDISFFNHLILNNINIKQNNNDTLFDIKSIDLAINNIDFEKQLLLLNKIKINKALIKLELDSTEHFNIENLISLFNFETDSNSPPWYIFAKAIDINKTRFIYHTSHTSSCPV
jgi:hypothetical protein